MFASDEETYAALDELARLVGTSERPLVLWIGAGASMWAGYPSWLELTSQMHSTFSREERAYDKTIASQLLSDGDYPKVFEHMKIANRVKYNDSLVRALGPRGGTAVYSRFLSSLKIISPLFLVTTNVDESLERHFHEPVLVQNSDIERIPALIHQRRSFICKLHGSASAVETAVFASSDYEEISHNQTYLSVLRWLLGDARVIFIGYGLNDQYVIRVLERSAGDRPLFGAGPHFVVTANDASGLPANVKRVRYIAEVADHREALAALEVVADSYTQFQYVSAEFPSNQPTKAQESIYFLPELMTPGTCETSQTISVESANGDVKQMIVGPGYVDGEIQLNNYSALHDIVVGLVCFDALCICIGSVGRVHELLGSPIFWELVANGAIRVVIPPPDPAVVFQDQDSVVGKFGFIALGSRSSTFEQFSPRTASDSIRRQLSSSAGREKDAEQYFQILESSMLDLSIGEPLNLAERTRAALVHPSVRRLLGMSRGTPLTSVPRWLTYPLLRLAGVVSTGIICQRIGASAARLIFGSESLAGAAFSTSVSQAWADDAASYVLTGRYNSDVGLSLAEDPTLLPQVVAFRQSQGGEIFRREVAQRLETNEGGLLATAVNAGLRQAIPPAVLERARDQLSGLFEPRGRIAKLAPAVFGDLRNSDVCIAGWRKRSRAILASHCELFDLNPYSACPCGSGEKLKFCCREALS
ncbi:SIR2 family protein [Candidatus Accumulibacter sp. ACC012]|uniref:SIR2 family protein n=1 Tax=Candidatus Accumulibacter sp. ACC012 TaxID=2823332 RepID=UPI0025B82579|nr:SIR2 family protein [Candidatus Accumulibacter sp. ACC012]